MNLNRNARNALERAVDSAGGTLDLSSTVGKLGSITDADRGNGTVRRSGQKKNECAWEINSVEIHANLEGERREQTCVEKN